MNATKEISIYQTRNKNQKAYVVLAKKSVIYVKKVNENWYETIIENQKVYILAKEIKKVKS
ncbi:MAG: hypothetical protein KBT36_17815 [Kurthia sp.]|nr:hypothetical protein [Candidatus Kurthia equi]